MSASLAAIARKAAIAPTSKSQLTREAILDAAVLLGGREGLGGLTIAMLAEATGMSRSGVFAHFGSKEDLQIATVQHYHQRFSAEVFEPALSAPKGLPRLLAIFSNWMRFASAAVQTGCIFIGGATEFDDKPGPVRDAIVASVNVWLSTVLRTIEMAVREGHIQLEMDARDLLLTLHGLILTLHYESRFLRAHDSQSRIERIFRALLHAQATAEGKALLAQYAQSIASPSQKVLHTG